MSRKLLFVVLTGLVLAGAALYWARARRAPLPPIASSASNRISAELLAGLARLEAQERELNETVWAKEMLAQERGAMFEALWDTVNAATNRLRAVATFPVGELVLGRWFTPRPFPHGITVTESSGPGAVLSEGDWRLFIETLDAAGWQLGEAELRHYRFETDAAGRPRESCYYFAAHLTHPGDQKRVVLEGNLVVEWGDGRSGSEAGPVKRIDASRLTLRSRRGDPPFREIFVDPVAPPEHAQSIDPLMLQDLDGDGLSEIILAAKNLVYRRQEDGRYASGALCRHPPGVIYTAVLADLDGDGKTDFLVAALEGLVCYRGSARGGFDEPGQVRFRAPSDWRYPMVLTCGDIDSDGDLDVFVGQYRVPYEGGSLPTPYHNANDGFPAFLLRNEGAGRFSEVTLAAGLGSKRWRRTYSASFVDLDGDRALDLVVVSDFAGVDLYRNDGRGRFSDVTRDWVTDARAFGMSHALADFNNDGRLDLLMLGMTSPTVDRLEHLGLWRPDIAEDRSMRARMMYGNRLYLARPDGGFESTRLSEAIARSGWSWGCSAPDFDNDGFADVYVANGLESRQSVRDYESEYWLHDRFVAGSRQDSAVYLYFQAKFGRTRGRGNSYGGYERNRFYLNQAGAMFLEVGHLWGVGLQEDSRHVVADDLDGDGRVDLLLTSYAAWPESRQTLRVYQNTLNPTGHWIGFRLRADEGGPSPIGACVWLHYDGRSVVRSVVTGDSHRSEHASTVHFGLGASSEVERAEIRWPNGGTARLQRPAVDRYHFVQP